MTNNSSKELLTRINNLGLIKMAKNLQIFFDFIKIMFTHMQELHNATKNQHVFKITKLVFDKDNNEFIVIAKSIGKNIKFEENARVLYEDNATLQGFSQLDVKIITCLACEANHWSTPHF